MQDGYIFSDTILRNIITGDHSINEERLERAIDISNVVRLFMYPLGYNTKIGAAGNNISGGQKQGYLSLGLFIKTLSIFYLMRLLRL